ncbi:hypothetical protein [Brotaphodocola sp.]
MKNRGCGDNGSYGLTESLRWWKAGRTQIVKWTAEGAVKGR